MDEACEQKRCENILLVGNVFTVSPRDKSICSTPTHPAVRHLLKSALMQEDADPLCLTPCCSSASDLATVTVGSETRSIRTNDDIVVQTDASNSLLIVEHDLT